MMDLRIMYPTGHTLETQAQKIVAEAENGFFCLLPKHIDFLSILVPGILMFVDKSGLEVFVAHNEAVLVKCGAEVSMATQHAALSSDLKGLARNFRDQTLQLTEKQRKVQAAFAKLEADFMRRFSSFLEEEK